MPVNIDIRVKHRGQICKIKNCGSSQNYCQLRGFKESSNLSRNGKEIISLNQNIGGAT
jgi:hypothetical protein